MVGVVTSFNRPKSIRNRCVFEVLVACLYVGFAFYVPGLKGPPGASSIRIARQFVRSTVHLSVRLSVSYSVPLTIKVQYLKFWRWYSFQTWAVSSSMGSSNFTDITWPFGGVKMLDLGICAIFWLCCRRGHPCFTNTCLIWIFCWQRGLCHRIESEIFSSFCVNNITDWDIWQKQQN